MREDIRVWNKKEMFILEAAEQLFIARGFEPVSIKQIAAAAGISGTRIFYYFPNKEKLLEAILQLRLEQLHRHIEAVAAETGSTLPQQLELIITKYIEQGLNNPLVLTRLFCANVAEAQTGESEEQAIKGTVLVRDMIAKAQQEGKVKQEINAMQVTALITGTVTCMVLNKEDFRTGCGLQQLEETSFRQQLQQTIVRYLHRVLQSIMIYA